MLGRDLLSCLMLSLVSLLGQFDYRRKEGGELIPRFSSHPSIALTGLQPHAYGNVFNDRAKVLLGSMLGVPSRETIIAFVLMSYISFANGTSRCHREVVADGRFRIGLVDVHGLCCPDGI
jgi:hypothetical protein